MATSQYPDVPEIPEPVRDYREEKYDQKIISALIICSLTDFRCQTAYIAQEVSGDLSVL